ncbi:MAG: HAMP domain-containing sensor histidine kinase [Oscillospiraceae bacterium]|nr:HAMP domain-containing sensor histidine kinase [Oscillospiraceae bacterium]
MMEHLLDTSDFEIKRTEARVEAFQNYVKKNNISYTDADAMLDWCNKQPLVLMEVYHNNKLMFNSRYSESDELYSKDIDVTYYDWYSYYTIQFSDGNAELLIYSDELYLCRIWVTIAEIVICAAVFLFIFLRGVRKVASYIYVLCSEIQALESGDLDHPITVQGKDELGTLAQELDSMRKAFLEQRSTEAASFQANQSLITGMSHDLRTPLTKLMLYTEILRSGKYNSESQMKDYLICIDEKAKQIKQLSDNIFQYSMMPKENAATKPEPFSMKDALHDSLSEMVGYLSQKGYQFDFALTWDDEQILVYEPFIKRLLDNLASNIEKYADISKPVRVELLRNGEYIGLSFQNAMRSDSTKQEGTNIGLTNINSMMHKMDGTCHVEQTVASFEIELWFQCVHTDEKQGE